MSDQIQFFLGANTPAGFKSLFDELYDPYDDWQMYIIKGGPGTGKSSLMKSVAREAESRGLYTERIPCSSDPLSLDGVIIPEIKAAIADGTAPHVVDPIFPGVCEQTVNLGRYWNERKLRENAEDIRRITIQNSEEHKKCVKYLRAAALINEEITDIVNNYINYDKLERFALRTAEKEFPNKSGKPYKVQRRFLSALTPLGIAVQYDTLLNLCDRVVTIEDNYSVASSIIIRLLAEYAKARHYDIILCNCPMEPTNKSEHLIIPELRLGFFTSNSYHPIIGKPTKTVHAERFTDMASVKNFSNKIAFSRKAKLDLIGEALERLEAAKAAHDVLESYYIAAMDFEGVAQERDRILGSLFK